MVDRNARAKRTRSSIVYLNVLICLVISLLAYVLARGTTSGMLIQSGIDEASWPKIELAVSIVSLFIAVGLAVFNLWFYPRVQKKRRLLLWGLIEAGVLCAVCVALFLLQILLIP